MKTLANTCSRRSPPGRRLPPAPPNVHQAPNWRARLGESRKHKYMRAKPDRPRRDAISRNATGALSCRYARISLFLVTRYAFELRMPVFYCIRDGRVTRCPKQEASTRRRDDSLRLLILSQPRLLLPSGTWVPVTCALRIESCVIKTPRRPRPTQSSTVAQARCRVTGQRLTPAPRRAAPGQRLPLLDCSSQAQTLLLYGICL